MSSQNILQYDTHNSLRDNLPTVKIRDEHSDEIFEYSYQEMVNYHGNYYIGGVALAYKLLTHIFSMLDEVPKRGHFHILNGLGPVAKGFIDGVEILTRAKSHDKLIYDPSLLEGIIAPLTPGNTKFYFEIGYKESYFKVRVKMAVACEIPRAIISEEDKRRLMITRKESESEILSTRAEDLFDFIQIKIK